MSSRRAHRARLRSLECLAYSSLLSYLRLDSTSSSLSDHHQLIEQIRPLLHISSDRHRAELKRLLNDEDLQRLKALKTMEKEKEKEKEEDEHIMSLPWIETGRYEFESVCRSTLCPKEWYQVAKIYVCEICLKTSISATAARRHRTKCSQDRPPGCLIYAQDDLQIYEVLGWKSVSYCEDLCLLATLFIESKVEIKNVHRFRFYVLMVKYPDDQSHIAGFFSKLQYQERLNLSCLLILPPYRNRGFGSLMIDLSYALSRLANVHHGTPERPLSTQGLLCYRKYWKSKIFDYLLTKTNEEQITINEISQATSISSCDIIETLASLNMIRMLEKDKLIIYRSQDLLEEHRQKNKRTEIKSNQVQYDRKCFKLKSDRVTLPFEKKCQKLSFRDEETVFTFLNCN